ncbi:MAG TPA: DNA primase [Rhodopila sp.]|nr:DNA primase [Rhodopila sp.]
MALPAGFLEELRTRTPLAPLVGRRVRLARSGKQWKGCCPFHGEKTPSFYVYEDGYHCFGCGAHGDAISFVMQSQGLGFMEAVQQLAAEAGLNVPKPTPEAAAAERRRLTIAGVLEMAREHYRQQLELPDGRAAKDYLRGRGLTETTIGRFGLGWSGSRGSLTAKLTQAGISAEQLTESGLIRRDEETGRTYELFSHRVMFPILDRRSTTVSFGGRIMGTGQPKYLHGPDTAAFSKRRNLYGLNLARDAVRNGAALIVVEGYMDVIAASQCGFSGAVAPLGTALTAEQLELLWEISSVPVLCFDGDTAGFRAASRAMELALPMLTPERSLKFATLPTGEDPDTLLRKGGPPALQAVIGVARSPAEALYDMLRGETGESTPEQRAALRSRLVAASSRIADKSLAAEYRSAMLDRFFASRARPKRNERGARVTDITAPRMPRPMPQNESINAERARILIAILVRHPFLLHDVAQAFNTLSVPPPLAQLRAAMEEWAETTEALDSTALINHLTNSGFHAILEEVVAGAPMPLPACASPQAMPAEAEAGWWHIFGFLNVEHLREEVALAEADAARNLTSDTQRRLLALRHAYNRVRSGESEAAGYLDA